MRIIVVGILLSPIWASQPAAGQTTLGSVVPEFAATQAVATPDAGQEQAEFRTLDESIQNLKTLVMNLNRDLFLLEEELLFPANTQVAIFVSMDVGEFFDLDSVQIKLNDQNVANYLYTSREVDAEPIELDSRELGAPSLAGADGQRRGERAGSDDLAGPDRLELRLVLQHRYEVRGGEQRGVEHVRAAATCLHHAVPRERDRKGPQLRDEAGQFGDKPFRTDDERTVQAEPRDGVGRLELPVREVALHDLTAVSDPVDARQELRFVPCDCRRALEMKHDLRLDPR